MTRIKHGTNAGYMKELREGIETCQPCRDAANERQKIRNARAARKKCSIRGCKNGRFCKSFCTTHYKKLSIHGDPLYKAPPRPLKPIEHGTRRGADMERARGLELCESCRVAKRIDDVKWKREQYKPPPSEYAKRQIALRARHQRALAALRDEFRDEYDEIYAAEKRKRKNRHLTNDGRRWRARATLAVRHPERFEELRSA